MRPWSRGLLWIYVIYGVVGFVLGSLFRVPALIAASGGVAVLSASWSVLAGATVLGALVEVFAALAVLQLSFLAGSVVACLRGDR